MARYLAHKPNVSIYVYYQSSLSCLTMTSFVEKNSLLLPLVNIPLLMPIVTWELARNTKSQAPLQTNWMRICSLIRLPDVLYACAVWEAMENWHCFELKLLKLFWRRLSNLGKNQSFQIVYFVGQVKFISLSNKNYLAFNVVVWCYVLILCIKKNIKFSITTYVLTNTTLVSLLDIVNRQPRSDCGINVGLFIF